MKARLSVYVVGRLVRECEIEVSPEGIVGMLLCGEFGGAMKKVAALQEELDTLCPGAKAEICVDDSP